ncbi:uncharacterized protein [Haliotis cracherodii]|uniref:uncharacterized protein n=1 Tax=Haliotis cracherodii TaxID=6455 RepID=UPI0039E8B885
MAGQWNLFTFLTFGIWIFAFAFTSASVSYCWYGDIESHASLMNETCASGKVSLANIVSRENGAATTLQPPQNLTHSTAGAAVSISKVAHCMIFRYMKHTEIVARQKTYEISMYANYSCDHPGLCKGMKSGWLFNVTYKGLHGDVYCCNTSQCNIHIQGIPPQQQICYSGSNITLRPTASLEVCKVPVCGRATWKQDGKRVTQYFCDNFSYCQQNGITVANNSNCKQVPMGTTNRTEEMCCCSRNKCYIPSWPVKQQSKQRSSNNSSNKQWIIAGTVITLTFCFGVGAGILLALMQHRKNARGDNHVALMYRRIGECDRQGDEDVLIT